MMALAIIILAIALAAVTCALLFRAFCADPAPVAATSSPRRARGADMADRSRFGASPFARILTPRLARRAARKAPVA